MLFNSRVILFFKANSMIFIKQLRFFLWRPLKKLFSLCIAEYTFKGFFSIKNTLGKLSYFKSIFSNIYMIAKTKYISFNE